MVGGNFGSAAPSRAAQPTPTSADSSPGSAGVARAGPGFEPPTPAEPAFGSSPGSAEGAREVPAFDRMVRSAPAFEPLGAPARLEARAGAPSLGRAPAFDPERDRVGGYLPGDRVEFGNGRIGERLEGGGWLYVDRNPNAGPPAEPADSASDREDSAVEESTPSRFDPEIERAGGYRPGDRVEFGNGRIGERREGGGWLYVERGPSSGPSTGSTSSAPPPSDPPARDTRAAAPFANGERPKIAIVDGDFSRGGIHSTTVKDVIETQLGADGDFVVIDEFDRKGLPGELIALEQVRARAEETGENYDYVVLPLSNDVPDFNPEFAYGYGFDAITRLYNAQYRGERSALGAFSEASPEERRQLARFGLDLIADDFEPNESLTAFLEGLDATERLIAERGARSLGAFVRDGDALLERGADIVIAAGNDPAEINGLALLKAIDEPGRGGSVVIVGALADDALRSDDVLTADEVEETRIAPFSSRNNVDVYAPGGFDATAIGGDSRDAVEGTSIAAPEYVASDIKRRSAAAPPLGDNVDATIQSAVLGPQAT